MNIKEIESLTEGEIEGMALESIEVKGHDVYFVDFGEYFGYSAAVCAEGRHIYYANDYELHHPNKTRDELRAWYEQSLSAKLFTEEELVQPSEEYAERQAKEHFIRNYYPMRKERVTMWYIGKPSEAQEAAKETMHPSMVAFAYFDDQGFVEKLDGLLEGFREANDPLRDYQHAKDAFKYEMFNHEYPINWQGDWDVISCFCKVKYKGDGTEIEQTGWSAEIKRAYRDAAREVQNAHEW